MLRRKTGEIKSSIYVPLHDGAQGLAEAPLLVAACCVGHIDCELGLHSNVVLQGDVIDLYNKAG